MLSQERVLVQFVEKSGQDPKTILRDKELNVYLRERTVLEKRSIAKMNNDDKIVTSLIIGGCEEWRRIGDWRRCLKTPNQVNDWNLLFGVIT